jgi:large subunit ribosomal protein L6
MSRIGKKPITIPENVTIDIKESTPFGSHTVNVKGPKGELTQIFKDYVSINQADKELNVVRKDDSKEARSFHGLYRTLLQNMVTGVTEGYAKSLEIIGIGYRAEMQGTKVILSLGYSHKINYQPPVGISIKVADQTNVVVEGADKQMVGEVAAKLRAFRKPEPYKGKGVRYKGEKVRRKSTKSGA